MRFSLRWLFVAVLVIAVCVLALGSANVYWAIGAGSVRLIFLALAVIAAIYFKGGRRAFWIGVLVFAYFHIKPPTEDVIVHSRVTLWFHSLVVGERQVIEDGLTRTQRLPNASFFSKVFDCICTVVLGLIGGCVATWLYRRNAPHTAEAERSKIESG